MSESSAPDEHVVFFTTALGDPAAERYPSLQSAVGRVESLCNEDHVQDAKVYALVPVPLQTRSYLHVAVDVAALQGVLPAPAAAAPVAPASPPPSATREPDTAPTPAPDLGDDAALSAALDLGEDTAAEIAPDDQVDGSEQTTEADTNLAESEAADESSPRGRNLGFFVH